MRAFPEKVQSLVELILRTPREELTGRLVDRIQDGLTESEMLAAQLIAACYDVQPRPSVGFKFHAVLVAQAVHLIANELPESDRWLPYLWAADYFKDSQADDAREGDWKLAPVDEKALPKPEAAKEKFLQAMHRWDEAEADTAVTVLARTAKPPEVWELFFPLGARDFRSIGHKAIDVANTHRVLGVIGWENAEIPLRSLAYALLMHEDGNPADRNASADEPGRKNWDRVKTLSEQWKEGSEDRGGVLELMETLRDGTPEEAPGKVVELLERGVGPVSIWDALFLQAAELVVRQPGIVSLHSVTTSRALHYAYRQSSDSRTQAYLLLQNASFLPMFRETMRDRGNLEDFQLDRLEPKKGAGQTDQEQVDAIFDIMSEEPHEAARRTLAYFQSDAPLDVWWARSRQLLVAKGRGPHDYKYTSAVGEIFHHLSPEWKPLFMASSAFLLKGSGEAENPLIGSARTMLSK